MAKGRRFSASAVAGAIADTLVTFRIGNEGIDAFLGLSRSLAAVTFDRVVRSTDRAEVTDAVEAVGRAGRVLSDKGLSEGRAGVKKRRGMRKG